MEYTPSENEIYMESEVMQTIVTQISFILSSLVSNLQNI